MSGVWILWVRAMRDLLAWNLYLGRWFGVQVRVHSLFVLVALVLLVVASQGQADLLPWYGALLGILFVSVLLHEAGHCYAAWRIGGRPNQIVLWPLGGLVPAQVPPDPLPECAVALAGPLTNLFVGMIGALILLAQQVPVGAALDPFAPPIDLGPLTALDVVRLTVWVNLWVLVGLNLLPALPMDGGRALRAMLWAALGPKWAAVGAAWAAQCVGVALCIAAWFLPEAAAFARVPIVALGVLLFFNARGELERPRLKDEAWPEGFDLAAADPLFKEELAAVADEAQELWDEEQDLEALRLRREKEEDEDRRVDEILGRLSQAGMEGLSPEDRALLARASRRYRSRQRG